MYMTLFVAFAVCAASALATNIKSPTPPMGWNTYNAYSCNPSEAKVKINAQGLVSTGLRELGYILVTPDCGWQNRSRDGQHRMQWNTTLFPSGGKALADYIHGLGLKFGLYSGAGYHQCGSYDLPGSLGKLWKTQVWNERRELIEDQDMKISMQLLSRAGTVTH